MDKAPNPSGWGLLFIIAFLAFLIWHGPVEQDLEISDSIQHGTIDCEKDDLSTLTLTQLELCIDIQSFKRNSDYE